MKLYLVLQLPIKVLVTVNVSYLNGGMMIKLLYLTLMVPLLSKYQLTFNNKKKKIITFNFYILHLGLMYWVIFCPLLVKIGPKVV